MHSWGISDFKAIAVARLGFDEARVTICTGTNSSGKSSVLQSILLLAQSSARAGLVTLNGPLLRLGAPSDVVREGQDSLAFEFEFLPSESRGNAGESADLRVRITMSPSATELRVSAIEVVDIDSELVVFEATSSRMNATDVRDITSQLVSDDAATLLRVTVEAGRRAPNRMYIVFRGLVPVGLAVRKPSAWIASTFSQAFEYLEDDERESPVRFRNSLLNDLSALVSKRDFLKRRPHAEPVADIRALLPSRWTVRDWREMPAEWKQELVTSARDRRAENEWVLVYGDPYLYGGDQTFLARRQGVIESVVAVEHEYAVHLLTAIADELLQTGQRVSYLGPLRDEPRVVHSAWDERRESLPVGSRGEFTAEVLVRLEHQFVQYRDVDQRPSRRLLPAAVAEWCAYLGIGDQIQVEDHGKLGHGVRLRVGGVYRDLTTIGVGASQLLPVLVAVLAAPRGRILLIEQPELHLHPAVQSRLADFFLYARPDIKLIVETHSEYLLTRLRRRVAEGRASPSEIAVIFVEQASGVSSARALNIDEFGDMSEWPKGFFDAQDEDSLAIMKAVRDTLQLADQDPR